MWLPKLKGGETDLENPDLKYLGRNLSQTLHPTNYGWGEGGGRSYKFLETRDPWAIHGERVAFPLFLFLVAVCAPQPCPPAGLSGLRVAVG